MDSRGCPAIHFFYFCAAKENSPFSQICKKILSSKNKHVTFLRQRIIGKGILIPTIIEFN